MKEKLDETAQEWKRCRKKPIEVEYREVWGEAEKIKTREGTLYGYKNEDYIIRGTEGELYPIKKKIFKKTYDKLDRSQCAKCNSNLERIDDDMVLCPKCNEWYSTSDGFIAKLSSERNKNDKVKE